jgi:hypothetical protein
MLAGELDHGVRVGEALVDALVRFVHACSELLIDRRERADDASDVVGETFESRVHMVAQLFMHRHVLSSHRGGFLTPVFSERRVWSKFADELVFQFFVDHARNPTSVWSRAKNFYPS